MYVLKGQQTTANKTFDYLSITVYMYTASFFLFIPVQCTKYITVFHLTNIKDTLDM